jgi:hypothetical protein
MKKTNLLPALLLALIAAFAVSCATTGQAGGSQQASGSQRTSANQSAAMNADAPDWYYNPPEDYSFVYGAGQALAGSESRTQQMAESRARASVLFQVSTMIDGSEKNFTEESGTDNDPAALNFFQAVNRQLASEVLKDARITKRWKRDDGTLFVLTEYPKKNIADTVKKMAESPASRLSAAKAELAIEKMDEELAKKQQQMNPVDHD